MKRKTPNNKVFFLKDKDGIESAHLTLDFDNYDTNYLAIIAEACIECELRAISQRYVFMSAHLLGWLCFNQGIQMPNLENPGNFMSFDITVLKMTP